ncbi:OmpP1/FadL family transporter [Bacteroides faecium]|uniref:Outer membrane beta-barrel protein n=1 Tax=Bacteroides faecium TaxID=2715212 RepID=A0A6H0KU18_9BACE|nr:outer membrane beta-barrel protein [Bacteroides faecium]QIU96822.1 outer membrane beta-barrel protein [Bacteroides faecium]
MRKISLIGFVMLIVSIPTFAGGLLTNTNQHAAFLRMLSRGATIEIDGALSNPAGLAFLPNDGFHVGLSIQSAFQTRNIDASFMTYSGLDGATPTVSDFNKYYKGKAAAPIIPSVFAAYKKGDWTISGFFAITGGGGKASFDDGLPMFESLAMAGIFQTSVENYKKTQGQSPIVTPNMYDINSAMDGKQYIYSVQLGLSYKINDWLSVFGGGRMNYFSGGYEGYLDAKLKESYGGKDLMNLALDCDQTGWGLTPVIGVDAKFGKFNFGAKYEFKTNLNIENNTKKNTEENGALAAFKHGVNTPNDIPSMLSVAAAYEILPVLRASVEYHFYDDKKAGMAGDKQKFLTKGTNEYLMGIEWDVIKQLTLSCGGQITDYGLSDDFQSDTSFSCDSYTLGVGAKVKLSERAALNVGYMWTTYEDYTKTSKNYNGTGLPGTNVYSRTNKVFGVSLDYRF